MKLLKTLACATLLFAVARTLTVGITDKGYEIFTLSKSGLDFPPYKI